MISAERIKKEFQTLASFDSESFSERATADYLIKILNELGFENITEDGAAAVYGGNAGNLYAFKKGSLEGLPLLLSAHMDVVRPGKGKKPVFHEDGTITSGGTTVLGADDINGLVEILEAVRNVNEEGRPHRDIEVLFTIGEELHTRGAAVFDYSKIKSREAYVPDLSGTVGTAATAAPSITSFEMRLKGRAAHAGFSPEDGIHAIAAMSDLIGRLPLGRPDAGSTFNVGTISGGAASNIVPEECVCGGEIRSLDDARVDELLSQIRGLASGTEEKWGVKAEVSSKNLLRAYHTPHDAAVVRRFQDACEALGLPGDLTVTFGGSDNNQFAANGITGIVLSCGMNDVHSTQEWTTVDELVKGAQLFAEIIQRP